MKIFARVNKEGIIVSISKVDKLPEGVDKPYADLDKGESVIEIKPTKELERTPLETIHDNYRVDIKTKKLMKKKQERKNTKNKESNKD